MLPDLGRLLASLYAALAATIALRVALGRWPPALGAVGGFGLLVLGARRLLAQRRPVAPDGWPPPGAPALAVATGDGVWRVHLPSGQAYPASSTGQPTAAIAVGRDRLRVSSPLAHRDTADWRTWTLSWPAGGSVTWRQPERPAALAAAGLPGRGESVLALTPDGAGGHYVGTGRWPAGLAMRACLAAPTSWLAGPAARLLERRWGRIYHVDAAGTRRLFASDLPPVFAIALLPTEGTLAGPPASVEVRPIPTGPPAVVVEASPA